MSRINRAGLLALAFATFVLEPVAANAGVPLWLCGPKAVSAASSPANIGALPVVWAFGFFLCAGMTLGKVEQDAKKTGVPSTHRQRQHALLECLIPIVGFWNLDHHQS